MYLFFVGTAQLRRGAWLGIESRDRLQTGAVQRKGTNYYCAIEKTKTNLVISQPEIRNCVALIHTFHVRLLAFVSE